MTPGSEGMDPDPEGPHGLDGPEGLDDRNASRRAGPLEVGTLSSYEPREGAAILRETMVGPQAARPQFISSSSLDYRYSTPITYKDLQDHDSTTPVSIRMEGFGAQSGAVGGPHLAESGPWIYTQKPGRSSNLGGTTNGGYALIVPELDMSDVDTDFAPPNVTKSSSYFIATPGVRFGVGVPELSTGGLRSGYSWGNESEQLTFNNHDGLGAATEVMRLTSDPKLLMAAELDMGTTNKITNLADPAGPQDAATKAYSDAKDLIRKIHSTAIDYSVAATIQVVLATGPVTVTLPDAAANSQRVIDVMNDGVAGVVTVDSDGGNINGDATQELGYNEAITAISNGVNWRIL